MVYVMTWRLSPILTLLEDTSSPDGDVAYQRFKAGFSRSQAVSGSSFIFATSTVALYAAKPVKYGDLSVSLGICSRAIDLMPVGVVSEYQIRYHQRIPSAATTKSALKIVPSCSVTDGQY